MFAFNQPFRKRLSPPVPVSISIPALITTPVPVPVSVPVPVPGSVSILVPTVVAENIHTHGFSSSRTPLVTRWCPIVACPVNENETLALNTQLLGKWVKIVGEGARTH